MRRTLLLAITFVVGCGGTATVTTVTMASESPTTAAPPPTQLEQVVAVQTCNSPPVTFSTLCEIYDLLEIWYVDRPLDSSILAESALAGMEAFSTREAEVPPRTLFCAIPHQDFAPICDYLAEEMTISQLPHGAAVEAAVTHMTETALDPFTYYLPPEHAGSFRLNGVVGGVGILLDARDAAGSKCARITAVCLLRVVTVLEGNAGFDAGLREGDVITHLDGEPVDGRGFASVVALIAGDETGLVELVVQRDGQTIDFAIERRELDIPTVEVGIPFAGIGYISIPDFETDITALVDEAMTELDGLVDTIVIDLRDNPGGFVETVVEVADRFVDGGVVMVSDGPDEHLEYEVNPGGSATTERLIVLVNTGTASAAEILAGGLRDRRGAIVVGTPTFGKDAVQIPFNLRNGGELYVAVARWSTPDGGTVANGGLIPDRVVEWPSLTSTEEIVSLALEAAS